MNVEGTPLLEMRDVDVGYSTRDGDVQAVVGFSLDVRAGECVGIVGESGAGKSQALLALMGLLSPKARVTGSAKFGGRELFGMRSGELDALRGADLSMVFQDPLTSLTPHLTVGDQVAEPLVRHRGARWTAARAASVQLLERVGVTDPARRADQFPHELSGGMRQRVMIAMALACRPKLIIADEPTTALDVTIQAQILSLLLQLKRESQMAMVLVTHDFGVVAGVADRVIVMRAGRIVEAGSTAQILKRPAHAYTRLLLDAVPRIDAEISTTGAERSSGAPSIRRTSSAPLLEVENLQVHFAMRGGFFRKGPALQAVEGVGLVIEPGEAVGIVGESGSGKSTLARAVLQLVRSTGGRVVWLGKSLDATSATELKALRRDMQLVFQDPLASLDPRMTVEELVDEPLRVHRQDLDARSRRQLVTNMLFRVGLAQTLLARYPHELSGGQAQRVGIARAMVLQPRLLICDEAVSALDVFVQGQIVSLLQDLKREFGTAILFISHNLAVVRQLCERVLVLYLGRMMEQGTTEALYREPAHPYTQGLLEAVPTADPDLQPARLERLAVAGLGGELPSPLTPPPGCVFNTRCPHVQPICGAQVPLWESAGPARQVACHRWRDIVRAPARGTSRN
jgi:oligopeptide/dipeptide ABC transporter ATP-binding protein